MSDWILAIDPGDVESAFAVVDVETRRPLEIGKVPNERLLADLSRIYWITCTEVHIEMIASYGMGVGEEVFETCVWIGRFIQALHDAEGDEKVRIVRTKRMAVKMHHCHDSRAKDPNITQALRDRFAPGQPNYGKGTKANPGFFHGFAKDVWQAYALGVYAADHYAF